MFRAIKSLLDAPESETRPLAEQRQLQLAVAVLLHEARRADYSEDASEWATAEQALCDLFAVSSEESTGILTDGRAKAQQLTSLYAPVATIKRLWGMPERI